MLYKFGDIVFQPNTMPTDFTRSKGVNFVEQDRLQGPPTLQDVGGVLTVIDWEITFHRQIAPVRESMDAFYALMYAKEPKPLINGTGYSEGDFVIVSIRDSYEQTDALGRILFAKMSIQLKEYVEIESVDKEALAARKRATGLISANPITTNPTVKFQTPQSLTMREIVAGNAAAGNAVAAGKQAAAVPELATKHLRESKEALETAKRGWQRANQEIDKVVNLTSNVTAIKATLASSIATVDGMINTVSQSNPNLADVRSYSSLLEASVANILTSTARLSTLTALRR